MKLYHFTAAENVLPIKEQGTVAAAGKDVSAGHSRRVADDATRREPDSRGGRRAFTPAGGILSAACTVNRIRSSIAETKVTFLLRPSTSNSSRSTLNRDNEVQVVNRFDAAVVPKVN